MELEKEGSVKGYHGTFLSSADKIISDGFTWKPRKDHWLGQGIYLYTSFYLAKWWCETKIKNKKLSESPAVLEVESNDKVRILNLDTDADFFANESYIAIKELESQGVKFKFEKDEKGKIKNRCFALDILKRKFNLHAIIYTFPKDNPSYADSINSKNIADDFGISYKETQICLTDNTCIKNKKFVYPTNVDSYTKMDSSIVLKRKGDCSEKN